MIENVILFVLVFAVFFMILLPPTWDPAIRSKHKREFKEPLPWTLGKADYWWMAASAVISFIVVVIVRAWQ